MSGIAATIKPLHFWRVFADCAVLASARLVDSAYRKHGCRDGTPYCRLGHGVKQIMAFEHLYRANDDKSTNENGKKTLDPECGTHRDAPCDA
jgi:hypothetical protein